jgi:hypothetical protein
VEGMRIAVTNIDETISFPEIFYAFTLVFFSEIFYAFTLILSLEIFYAFTVISSLFNEEFSSIRAVVLKDSVFLEYRKYV